MPRGWEGKHRSDVAMAMHQWFIHLRAQSLRKGDEAMLLMGHGTFTLPFCCPISCLQCFDTVGWATGRAFGL